MTDSLEGDKSIAELRALLARYEERLSRSSDRTPESHAARGYSPEPLFLLNDMAVDLRPAALENCPVIEAPTIVDCFQPEESEPFLFVFKVRSGVFRVHPRQDRVTAAIIGPFSGPAPSGFIATAQTTHGSAPTVRFHLAIAPGDIDPTTLEADFGTTGQNPCFLSVPPRHHGYLVATNIPQARSPAASSDPAWSLVLATVADPPEEIAFAWAEFSDIALIFPSHDGNEVRLLS